MRSYDKATALILCIMGDSYYPYSCPIGMDEPYQLRAIIYYQRAYQGYSIR